ncbi:MAG TPA: isoprenylcysteine carboxylmethyltransferase family protein [Acidobacteriaceae bacterium]|nr:isoprenylcysteine carboxylmethyltransferase family protein [Acidobacteriaceae bacterium]
MKATQFEFRFRIWIAVALYVLGFSAPWSSILSRYVDIAPDTTAWLALSTALARLGWFSLSQATILVTSLAIACVFLGSLLRIWGTAYLGSSVVHSGAMHAEQVMASGPYRYTRNPLYLGTWLFSIGVAILMPPSGAVFFLLGTFLFYYRLILGEEDYLTKQQGAAYLEYRRRVPQILPSLRPRLAASEARPRWLQGLIGESFTFAFACCFAVLAWRYEAHLLIRCILICFGLSLVTRAFLPRESPAPA